MKYLVVIEQTASGSYSAYSPDLPGCIAAGKTIEETKNNISDAIHFHLEGLQEDHEVIPLSRSQAEYIEVPA